MIASSYPQLGWLAPQTAAAESPPDIIAPTARATGLDSQELRSILVNLAAVRQSVNELAVQFAASQQQMANDIAKLNAAEQDIFDKISSAPPPRPAAAPARKPVPRAPAANSTGALTVRSWRGARHDRNRLSGMRSPESAAVHA